MSRNIHLQERRDDDGAMLIIALVLILAIAIALGAIAQLATGSLKTTGNLKTQRGTEIAAENATTMAVQHVRVTYNQAIYTSAAGTACLPGPPGPFVVYCVGANKNLSSQQTRTVQFYTCPWGTPNTSCTSLSNPSTYLYAQVTYDDVIQSALPPNNNLCNTVVSSSCGLSMSMTLWDVRTADN